MKRICLLLLMGLMLIGCENLSRGDDYEDSSNISADDKKVDKKKKEKEDEKAKEDAEKWLAEIASENIDKLTELANDETYFKLIYGDDKIGEIISEWGEADIDKDSEVVVAKVNISSMVLAASLSGEEDFDDLSEVGQEWLESRAGASIGNVINAKSGSSTVAASAMVQYGKSYITPYEIDNQIWFVPSDEEGLAYCVSFSNSGEGVISVGVTYVYYGEEQSLKKAVNGSGMASAKTIDVDWE